MASWAWRSSPVLHIIPACWRRRELMWLRCADSKFPYECLAFYLGIGWNADPSKHLIHSSKDLVRSHVQKPMKSLRTFNFKGRKTEISSMDEKEKFTVG
jgi:hypothetical protein